jgi:chemotaxis protein MotB
MANEQNQEQKEQPIIIKKKKGGGGHGHHGGAWKVAYADFVTAMMAFFIVMWILGMSPEAKESIQAYYEDPGAFDIITGTPILVDLGNPTLNSGKEGDEGGDGYKGKYDINGFRLSDTTKSQIADKLMEKAAQDSIFAAEIVEQMGTGLKDFFEEQMQKTPELSDLLSSIKIEITDEGLRIELIESSESMFFTVGSAQVNREASQIIEKLAREIGGLPNQVDVEGHTDSRKYSGASGYSNWELSTDRANSARRILAENGTWDGQITKVTGYADQKLRNQNNPFDVENRRVSILIRHLGSKHFAEQQAAILEGGNEYE